MKKTYAISISQSCLLTNQGEKKKMQNKFAFFFFCPDLNFPFEDY